MWRSSLASCSCCYFTECICSISQMDRSYERGKRAISRLAGVTIYLMDHRTHPHDQWLQLKRWSPRSSTLSDGITFPIDPSDFVFTGKLFRSLVTTWWNSPSFNVIYSVWKRVSRATYRSTGASVKRCENSIEFGFHYDSHEWVTFLHALNERMIKIMLNMMAVKIWLQQPKSISKTDKWTLGSFKCEKCLQPQVEHFRWQTTDLLVHDDRLCVHVLYELKPHVTKNKNWFSKTRIQNMH